MKILKSNKKMNLSLKGKRAIVCGSTQGIGKAIAIKLAKQQANITLIARDENKLKNVLNLLESSPKQKHNFIVADFNYPKNLKKKIKKFLSKGNTAEILINNTGGPSAGKIIEAKKKEFDQYISMHLHCSHYLVKALAPHMKKNKFGRIVNVISISVKAPIQNLGISNTVRWAMASWSKTLSFELGKFGITVNNILPGFTLTNRLKDLIVSNAKTDKKSIKMIENEYKNTIPAERFASPEEIASATCFLCSKEASYINGINLPVDGGYSVSL